MNYLLFVYYDSTVENSEEKTNQIASQISNVMTSKEIKFMFGDKHSIFHFASDLSLSEMGELMNIIVFDLEGFEYFLTQKTKHNFSNFPEENIQHLLSLKKTSTKKKIVPTPPKTQVKGEHKGYGFFDVPDFILNFKRPEVCNLTLDELLDKIGNEGIDSLSTVEKEKLDEYSKSI